MTMENGNRRTRKEMLTEMCTEFRQLRNIIREAGEAFIIRKESEVETLVEVVETFSVAELRAISPDWLRQIKQLKLKPAKGRLKDLKQIVHLMEEFQEKAEELREQANRQRKKAAKSPPPARHDRKLDRLAAEPLQ